MKKEFAIKVRKTGDKRWAFLSGKGGMNYLLVHALRFQDQARAQAVIDENAPNNPGVEWKVVDLFPANLAVAS